MELFFVAGEDENIKIVEAQGITDAEGDTFLSHPARRDYLGFNSW